MIAAFLFCGSMATWNTFSRLRVPCSRDVSQVQITAALVDFAINAAPRKFPPSVVGATYVNQTLLPDTNPFDVAPPMARLPSSLFLGSRQFAGEPLRCLFRLPCPDHKNLALGDV